MRLQLSLWCLCCVLPWLYKLQLFCTAQLRAYEHAGDRGYEDAWARGYEHGHYALSRTLNCSQSLGPAFQVGRLFGKSARSEHAVWCVQASAVSHVDSGARERVSHLAARQATSALLAPLPLSFAGCVCSVGEPKTQRAAKEAYCACTCRRLAGIRNCRTRHRGVAKQANSALPQKRVLQCACARLTDVNTLSDRWLRVRGQTSAVLVCAH